MQKQGLLKLQNKQKYPRTAGGAMIASNSEDQKIKTCL